MLLKVGIDRKRQRRIVIAFFCLVITVACRWENLLFSASVSVPQQWTRMDTVEFNISEQLSNISTRLTPDRSFRFVVDIRYTRKYAYPDLCLQVRHNVTDSLNWQIDTLRCSLYDGKGKPLGKGLANLYAIEVPYATLVADGGNQVCVQMVHCMADDSLKGITDLGIRVQSIVE